MIYLKMILTMKKKNKFFVNLEMTNYEKTAMFWFFFIKAMFKIYLDKKYNKNSLKNFYIYLFYYNIHILVIFNKNNAIEFNQNKKFFKIDKMVLFSSFKLFLINYWNIEFVNMILNTFAKIKTKKRIGFSKKNLVDEFLNNLNKIFIKITPLNQLKLFQLFVCFLFEYENSVTIFIIFKHFLKKLMKYLTKIYLYNQYTKYLFSLIFKVLKKTNYTRKFNLYNCTFLKIVKILIPKKNKSLFQFKKITNVIILCPNFKFLDQKYNIITRVCS
nr:hypothetical protein CcurKRNrm1_p047 [Cryptomonas curvata]